MLSSQSSRPPSKILDRQCSTVALLFSIKYIWDLGLASLTYVFGFVCLYHPAYIKWNEIFLYLVLIPCNSISVPKLFRTSWGRSENLHFFFCSVILFFFFPPPKKEVICFNLWKWVLRTIKLRMDSFLNLGYRAIFYRSLLKWVSFEMCPLWLDLASMYYYGPFS